jgi:hypothetical protein
MRCTSLCSKPSGEKGSEHVLEDAADSPLVRLVPLRSDVMDGIVDFSIDLYSCQVSRRVMVIGCPLGLKLGFPSKARPLTDGLPCACPPNAEYWTNGKSW